MVDISKFFQFGLFRFGGSEDINSVMENKIKPGLNWFVAFSVVVAVTMVIVAGYNLITSNGDPDKIQKGTKGITAAVIGMIVVFTARIFLVFILEKLGVE